MQAINTLLSLGHSTLLIAPTGWGKTTLLFDLIKKSDSSWVYLAPLRALANEFYLRAQNKIKGSTLVSHAREVQNLVGRGLEFKLIVITPELMSEKFFNHLKGKVNFIFDEIHLFYYWGDTFRPKLFDIYMEVVVRDYPALFLTATMDASLLNRFNEDLKSASQKSFIINIKNHTLKKDPFKTSYIPSCFKEMVLDDVIFKKTTHTKLIFCAYRSQVHYLKNKIQRLNKTVVTCIGGESQFLAAKLHQCPNPDFIIATSAASHGVNLPKISIVYIMMKVGSYDFWIQMVGRGGRQGEEYEVYSMDDYRITRLNKVRSVLILTLKKLWLKIYPYELRRYFNS